MQAHPRPTHILQHDEHALCLYAQAIPAFVEKEMDDLHANVFSSLGHLRLHDELGDVHTWRWLRHGRPAGLLLVRARGRHLRILNEGMVLDSLQLKLLALSLFCWFPRAACIELAHMRAGALPPCHPSQRARVSEDNVIELPSSFDAYLASLGAATRKNVRRHLKHLRAAHPGMHFALHEGAALQAADVEAVIRFNRARMAAKGKVSGIDAAHAARLQALARTHGVLALLRLDGAVAAGAIVMRFGAHYYSLVLAHDPRHDDLRLGLLLSVLLVEALIARDARTLHLMWGRDPLKAQLGAQLRELENVVVYRSPRHLLLCTPLAVAMALRAASRRARLWLLEEAPLAATPGARLANVLVQALRQGRSLLLRRRAAASQS